MEESATRQLPRGTNTASLEPTRPAVNPRCSREQIAICGADMFAMTSDIHRVSPDRKDGTRASQALRSIDDGGHASRTIGITGSV
jgi:hypothetical protein